MSRFAPNQVSPIVPEPPSVIFSFSALAALP